MTETAYTPGGIAFDRVGPRADLPVVLLHAGIADRRMWNPQWEPLTSRRDMVRLDLRGFGQSDQPPTGPLSPLDDVLDTLAALEIGRCHLVGASFGAGIAVEAALTRPELVASLLLAAPGGSLITDATPDLQAFFDAESSALEADDLDGAVEANLTCWVDGPHRSPDEVDPVVREMVRQMQRRAFEITADWDMDERELDPPAHERLSDVQAPTLVLVGALDLDAIQLTARRVAEDIPNAERVDWPDTAHLPSMERPENFEALLEDWLARQPAQ